MSKGNVDKFLGLMQKDEGLARKMAACLYMLENGGGKAEGSGGFIAREIVPLAKEYGFEFTEQDFLDYTEEAKTKVGLSDDDLAEVSGGKGGVRAALIGTLALLGVAAAPAAMEMVSGGEVAPFSMVASAETPKEEKSEQATPEQLEELQLGIAALKSLHVIISSSKLAEKDMLSKRCVSFLNKGEESLKSELKKDVEQSVKDIAGFVDYLRSQGVTSTWSANATANGVDVLKGRADNILSNVNAALQKGNVEEIAAEIQNIEDFLQYLNSLNIEDVNLNQKKSELEQKKAELKKKKLLEQKKTELKTALDNLQKTFDEAVREGYFEDKDEEKYNEKNGSEYWAKQAKGTLRLDTQILNADDGNWTNIHNKAESVNALIKNLKDFIEGKKLKKEQDEIKELVESIGNEEVAVEEVADEADKAKLAKQIDIRIKAYEKSIQDDYADEDEDNFDLDYEDMPGWVNLMKIKAALENDTKKISKETFKRLEDYSNEELFSLDENYSAVLKKYAKQYENNLDAAIENATNAGLSKDKIDEATQLKQKIAKNIKSCQGHNADELVKTLMEVEEAIDSLNKKEDKPVEKKDDVKDIEVHQDVVASRLFHDPRDMHALKQLRKQKDWQIIISPENNLLQKKFGPAENQTEPKKEEVDVNVVENTEEKQKEEKKEQKKPTQRGRSQSLSLEKAKTKEAPAKRSSSVRRAAEDENAPLQAVEIEEQPQAVAQREQVNVVQEQKAVIVDVDDNSYDPFVEQEDVKPEEQVNVVQEQKVAIVDVVDNADAPFVEQEDVKPEEQVNVVQEQKVVIVDVVENADDPFVEQEDVKPEEQVNIVEQGGVLGNVKVVEKTEEEKLAEAKADAQESLETLEQAITDANGLGGQALKDAMELKKELERVLNGSDANSINDTVSKIDATVQALEKAVLQSLVTKMEAKIDNVKVNLGQVELKTKTDLETNLEKALNQAKPKYDALTAALQKGDAGEISTALKDARTQYEAFTGAITTYLKGLKAEVEDALQTEAKESRPYLVKIKKAFQTDTSSLRNIDKQLEKGELYWIKYIRLGIENIKTVKASYDKLDELKKLINEKKEQLGKDSQIIVDAEKRELKLRDELDKGWATASLAGGCAEQAKAEINKLNAAVDLANAKEATKEQRDKLEQAITDANGLGGQALTDATNLKTELEKAQTADEFNEAVEKIDKAISDLLANPEVVKQVAEKLKQDLKAKIDNVEANLKKVDKKLITELEKNLGNALDEAKTAYEALAAALEEGDAGKISAALKDARTQYEAFTGAITTYLKGLKAEVEDALQTEANESRPYLVKIKEELQTDTSKDNAIDKQLEKGQLTWIQYIRLDLANIKTVKASYDKLDGLKALIEGKKEQLGEDSLIIKAAEAQEQRLRNKLNSETYTAGLATGCSEPAEKEINELKVLAAEKAEVELAEAKENAEKPLETLKKAIASANGYGGQALEDAIKLKNDLDTALKGSDANAINDTVAKIDGTIKALNKAKLEELPNSAPVVLKRLNYKLNVLENMRKMQNRTDEQKTINDLRNRIEKFGKVTNENATEKEKELKSIEKDINTLNTAVTDFEGNLSIHVKKPKKHIGEMLTFFKNAATQAKDKAAVEEIEKLEQELAAMPEELPKSQKELIEIVVKLKNITKNIPQIKETLEKATDLKEIAEQVDDKFAEVFDNIIKEIEAADSVDKINLAEETLQNAEITLKGLMRTKINKANKTIHILHEIAKIFGLNQLKGNFLNLIDTFDRFDYDGAPIDEIYKVYQDIETVKIAENELKNYLGEQIDGLVNKANELKDQANSVDSRLYSDFNDMATNLAADKNELLKDLSRAAQTIANVKTALDKYQGDLMPKLALKKQIATLKEQANKLKDMATGVSDDHIILFSTILIDLNKKLNVTQLEKIKQDLDACAKTFIEKLKLSEEIDELLKNEVMGAEIQAELKAIKAALAEDKADAAAVLKAVDDLKAAKTKMANKLLEWHSLLSEYHNKGYNKEGKTDVVEINLAVLNERANQMLNGADGIKLDVETLKDAVALAIEIADNLKTDIVSAVGNVQSYNGFGSLDITAGTQANTLATFLREKIDIVDDLKFVDKQTRAKLATDIKHIFDQIKIDQETGKYYLPGFYNQLGAVNHDDLKRICEAYDVIAEDFGARPSYKPLVEGTTETTNGLSFSSMFSSFTGAKKQNQLINKANHLINELKKVSRLDLLDVSPEIREALKNDILEIGAKIKSTSGLIYGRTLSLDGVDPQKTKNMQSGLEKILEFYNSIQAQMNVKK